jgi:hypothetical protein
MRTHGDPNRASANANAGFSTATTPTIGTTPTSVNVLACTLPAADAGPPQDVLPLSPAGGKRLPDLELLLCVITVLREYLDGASEVGVCVHYPDYRKLLEGPIQSRFQREVEGVTTLWQWGQQNDRAAQELRVPKGYVSLGVPVDASRPLLQSHHDGYAPLAFLAHFFDVQFAQKTGWTGSVPGPGVQWHCWRIAMEVLVKRLRLPDGALAPHRELLEMIEEADEDLNTAESYGITVPLRDLKRAQVLGRLIGAHIGEPPHDHDRRYEPDTGYHRHRLNALRAHLLNKAESVISEKIGQLDMNAIVRSVHPLVAQTLPAVQRAISMIDSVRDAAMGSDEPEHAKRSAKLHFAAIASLNLIAHALDELPAEDRAYETIQLLGKLADRLVERSANATSGETVTMPSIEKLFAGSGKPQQLKAEFTRIVRFKIDAVATAADKQRLLRQAFETR